MRRRVEFEKVGLQRRDLSSAVSSYTYGGNLLFFRTRPPYLADDCLLPRVEVDKDGYVVIHGGSAPTIVSNDAATGLDSTSGY